MRQREFRGEITVFLSLIFVLTLSLVGALLQSASLHTRAGMKRADAAIALENVFAEYHKELWDKYDILARVIEDENTMSGRMEFYGMHSMEHGIQKIRFLSDDEGQGFYEQAVRVMGGDVKETTEIPKESVEEEAEQSETALEELLKEENQSLPKENNPIQTVNELRAGSLLSVVLSDWDKLSAKAIEPDNLASHRELRAGQGFTGKDSGEGLLTNGLFAAYLMEHFSCYSGGESEQGLDYELEYLLEGQESDQKNLEKVAGKLLLMRLAVNYAYLLTDQTKQAEAETVALTLSCLLEAPAAAEIVKQALLVAWAYGESMVDLRVLFQGKKTPAIKTSDTWQLSLSSLVTQGASAVSSSEGNGKQGMSYKDYLLVLLAMDKKESLSMRALDVIEWNLDLRVDSCVTAVEIKSSYQQPRIGEDSFTSYFAYQ